MQRSTDPIDWQSYSIEDADLEFLSAYLLEQETPLGSEALAEQLIAYRIANPRPQAKDGAAERAYLPKDTYAVGDRVYFPALKNIGGQVRAVRPAEVINSSGFDVIQLEMEDGRTREFAAGLAQHALNDPPKPDADQPSAAVQAQQHAKDILPALLAALRSSPEFVYIAGRWFPKALIVDVDPGQLNVAEAILDMAGGGPLPTSQLLGEVELPDGVNPKLAEFSLDLALQNDPRFDEVGSTGEVAWFLRRLEPEAVQKLPLYLQYTPVGFDPSPLSEDMRDLVRSLDDELSFHNLLDDNAPELVEVSLIFPHWRGGTLPLTPKMAKLFPSAIESPRVRFTFVDEKNGESFPGWVVRSERYIYGLLGWLQKRGLMPGSLIRLRRGEKPGEIIVSSEAHRSSKEWVRTALVGADGGVVYATLKQQVNGAFDERMMIYLPGDLAALDAIWLKRASQPAHLESIVAQTLQELSKLSLQGNVHAAEIYSAVNLTLRCPPGRILAELTGNPRYEHVGHLHFRMAEAE
ncbi:MAG: hypothetical protein KF828_06140 [Anaerolineales bacterium]|jgi:hypothetical protein|nr:hypothetical protein [Anaerolineales bacterium]